MALCATLQTKTWVAELQRLSLSWVQCVLSLGVSPVWACSALSGTWRVFLVSLTLYFSYKYIQRLESKGQAGYPFRITPHLFQNIEA